MTRGLLTTKILQTVNCSPNQHLGFDQLSHNSAPQTIHFFYMKRPKAAATTASTPPVTSTPNAEAAPVLVALAALPLADPESDSVEPEVALAALDVAILDPEEVLLATILVVVP